MQSPSKLHVTSVSTPTALSRLQGWADLPDGPLHSIVALSGSFRDLLAFAATCRSWRAAFSSYPSKSTFCTTFPPLLVQPNVRVQAPHLPSNNGRHELRTCKVIDPTNRNIALHCQIPRETYRKMHFVGSSYGQLICCHRGYCLVVDVFRGAEVSPPRFPFSDDCEEFYYSGTLTAPLASANPHLLIVEFNGQFIAMDCDYKIYTLQLAPQLGLQEITTEWCGDMAPSLYVKPWLVVCGDMLLMVSSFCTISPGWSHVVCILHHLDMSTNPAKWVEVQKLDNWALFLGGDARSPQFSCMSPEQWGGRSKWLYYADHHSQPWNVHGLGDEPDPSAGPRVKFERSWCRKLQPFWVYPSMFYSDGQ